MRKCVVCGYKAEILCDAALSGPKAGKTCDKPLCKRCAVHVGIDKDLCPAHARMGLHREEPSNDHE